METCPLRYKPPWTHHLCPLPATPGSIPQVCVASALSLGVTQCGGMESEAETPGEAERVIGKNTDKNLSPSPNLW